MSGVMVVLSDVRYCQAWWCWLGKLVMSAVVMVMANVEKVSTRVVVVVIVLFTVGDVDVSCSGDVDGRDSNVVEGGAGSGSVGGDREGVTSW